jgi:hypothetical protein
MEKEQRRWAKQSLGIRRLALRLAPCLFVGASLRRVKLRKVELGYLAGMTKAHAPRRGPPRLIPCRCSPSGIKRGRANNKNRPLPFPPYRGGSSLQGRADPCICRAYRSLDEGVKAKNRGVFNM